MEKLVLRAIISFNRKYLSSGLRFLYTTFCGEKVNVKAINDFNPIEQRSNFNGDYFQQKLH
jgi:hypothetical protein